MDTKTFIVKIVGEIAWPTTTIVTALLILWKLPTLSKFIESIQYKGLKINIRHNLDLARVEAEKVSLELRQKPSFTNNTDKVIQLVQVDASIALIEIWRGLESKIIELIQHNGLIRFTTPSAFMEHLRNLNKLSSHDLALYDKLREIKNAIIHTNISYSLTKSEVLEFNNFVKLIILRLDEIKNDQQYIDRPSPV